MSGVRCGRDTETGEPKPVEKSGGGFAFFLCWILICFIPYTAKGVTDDIRTFSAWMHTKEAQHKVDQQKLSEAKQGECFQLVERPSPPAERMD